MVVTKDLIWDCLQMAGTDKHRDPGFALDAVCRIVVKPEQLTARRLSNGNVSVRTPYEPAQRPVMQEELYSFEGELPEFDTPKPTPWSWSERWKGFLLGVGCTLVVWMIREVVTCWIG